MIILLITIPIFIKYDNKRLLLYENLNSTVDQSTKRSTTRNEQNSPHSVKDDSLPDSLPVAIFYEKENQLFIQRIFVFLIAETLVFLLIYSTEVTTRILFYYDPFILLFAFLLRRDIKKFCFIILTHVIIGITLGLFFRIIYRPILTDSFSGTSKFLNGTEVERAENFIDRNPLSDYPTEFIITYTFSIGNIFSQALHLLIFLWFQNIKMKHFIATPLSQLLCDLFLFLLFTSQIYNFSSAIAVFIISENAAQFLVVLFSGMITTISFYIILIINEFFNLNMFNINISEIRESFITGTMAKRHEDIEEEEGDEDDSSYEDDEYDQESIEYEKKGPPSFSSSRSINKNTEVPLISVNYVNREEENYSTGRYKKEDDFRDHDTDNKRKNEMDYDFKHERDKSKYDLPTSTNKSVSFNDNWDEFQMFLWGKSTDTPQGT